MALRLLFVSHSLPPKDRPLSNVGGMQRVAEELVDALQKREDVSLQTFLLRSSWRWTHLRTVPFLGKLLWQIPRYVQSRSPDVVLFSSMVTASLAPVLRQMDALGGVKLAAIAHGRDVTLPVSIYQGYIGTVFDHLDLVVPVSRATERACRERGLSSDKSVVIPNGVAPERFQSSTAGNGRAVRRSESSRRGLLLCSVGRLVERKGFVWFVREVMPRLPDSVHYWLVGEGPRFEAIQRAAHANEVADRVRLFGHVSESRLVEIYREADLFVMPNISVPGDMEGFGVVMLEAGISGTPIVAADLEGIADVVEQGQNGQLVEAGNPDAFVEAILDYQSTPDKLQEASLRAARYTDDHFSWSVIVNRYVASLSALARQPSLDVESSG